MTKKTGYVLMLSLVGGLAITACDSNDSLQDVVDDRLDELDIDGDLAISRDEWNGGFILFDDNNDQLLVFDEFRFSGTLFDIADLNNDGVVTDDEWDDLDDIIDTDDDNIIEEGELALYF